MWKREWEWEPSLWRTDFITAIISKETAVIYTPSVQLMSVIHQRNAFMRHCGGNIMLTGSLLYLGNMNQQTCKKC